MERFYTFNVSVSYVNIKCPTGKSYFAVYLALTVFRSAIAITDIGSLRFINSIFDTYLDHRLAKFELQTSDFRLISYTVYMYL